MLGYGVGFMSPDKDAPANPKYKEVCSGKTGHVEVLHLRFNNKIVPYEELVKFFFTFHDPTTKNKQGNDKGTQYASAIFYHNDAQKQTAKKVKEQLGDLISDKKIPQAKFVGFSVSTAILEATKFYPAHGAH